MRSLRIVIGWQMLALLICLLAVFPDSGEAAPRGVHEDQIKAVFLYNLTHFVNWPEEIDGQNSSFDIGIVGSTSFTEVLDLVVRKETKNDQPIKVKRYSRKAAPDWEILYIDDDRIDQWESIQKEIAGKDILTVSDHAEFTRMGGMVSLIRNDKNIRIEVNYRQVESCGLTMSAKLLKVAEIVE